MQIKYLKLKLQLCNSLMNNYITYNTRGYYFMFISAVFSKGAQSLSIFIYIIFKI